MSDRRALALDVALAVAATVAILAITPNIAPTHEERELDALAYATMAVAGASLALRRRFPRAVLAIITVALVVYTRRAYPGGPVYLTMVVPLYTLAAQAEHRREALVPAAIAVAVTIVGGTVALPRDIEWTWHAAVFPGWAAAALFLGEAAGSRRAYLAGLEERARYLEETRDEEARRRVAEERLRIARDLHDVIAHSIATINLQSAWRPMCSSAGPTRRARRSRRSGAPAAPPCRSCGPRSTCSARPASPSSPAMRPPLAIPHRGWPA